ncbi:hypothetical protein HY025_03220 [Candidatus Daviesbacteria bacterium]|nr:hypothetical protein [Candidatus Daviesbacteria bacterium]
MINGGSRERGAPGTMIFRSGPDAVVRSPEELARQRTFVSPAYMDEVWGAGSAKRYMQTQRSMMEAAEQTTSFPSQGSIHFK